MTPSDPDLHADSNAPPNHELNGHELNGHELNGHELTPMETFFDNLFNQHMVVPQPPEEPPPIEGVD